MEETTITCFTLHVKIEKCVNKLKTTKPIFNVQQRKLDLIAVMRLGSSQH